MSDSGTDNEADELESITLPFGRATKSKNSCIICKKKNNLVVILADAKLKLFLKRELIIAGNQRCCKRHLDGSYFKKEEMYRIKQVAHTTNFTDVELINDFK